MIRSSVVVRRVVVLFLLCLLVVGMACWGASEVNETPRYSLIAIVVIGIIIPVVLRLMDIWEVDNGDGVATWRVFFFLG
ncbi:hypothetical protein HQ544_02970 [Candidatus Falkowbacteria bacterium]|nr:hypothetical protein [Candidatus Falkowbacteria bacterium]